MLHQNDIKWRRSGIFINFEQIKRNVKQVNFTGIYCSKSTTESLVQGMKYV